MSPALDGATEKAHYWDRCLFVGRTPCNTFRTWHKGGNPDRQESGQALREVHTRPRPCSRRGPHSLDKGQSNGGGAGLGSGPAAWVCLPTLVFDHPQLALGGGNSPSETFYPFGVQVAGSPGNGGPLNATTGTYSDAWLPSTGELTLLAIACVGFSASIALLLAVLSVLGKADRRPTLLLIMGIAAVGLAITGPSVMALAQPSTICPNENGAPTPIGPPPLDRPGTTGGATCEWVFWLGQGGASYPGSSSGPQSTFIGQASSPGGELSWGPAAGWYLALVGACVVGPE